MIFFVAIDRIRLTISHKYLAIWPSLFVCIFVGCLILDCGVLEKPVWVITSQSIADIFFDECQIATDWRMCPVVPMKKLVPKRSSEKITEAFIWKFCCDMILLSTFLLEKLSEEKKESLEKSSFHERKKNTTVDSKRDLSARGVFKAFNSAPLICNSKVTFASYDKLTTNTILIF